MKTESYRKLDKLTPEFSKKVNLFLLECPEVFVAESWRSQIRQDELFLLGLSQVKHSNHQDGKAIDIAFVDDLKTPQKDPIYPTDMVKWCKVADIARKYGIDWGYDLWKWDKPHFQDNGIAFTTNLPKPMNNKYKDILDGYLKDGYTPVFSSHDGDAPLTEAETKSLIDIGFARS